MRHVRPSWRICVTKFLLSCLLLFLLFLLLKETTHSGFFYCFASVKNRNFDPLYLCNRLTYQQKNNAIWK